jgi:hypothetical protein
MDEWAFGSPSRGKERELHRRNSIDHTLALTLYGGVETPHGGTAAADLYERDRAADDGDDETVDVHALRDLCDHVSRLHQRKSVAGIRVLVGSCS